MLKKNTKYNLIRNTIKESINCEYNFTQAENLNTLKMRSILNVLLRDMIHSIDVWRQIRGYPKTGSTTYTNAKSSRKNKIFFNYRLEQFYFMFGQKKRNVYPTLIKAEYNNRLWYYNWFREWTQASFFVLRCLNSKGGSNLFNPAILAQNQTNGYTRVGKAAKIGKAKKLTKMFTLGVPVLFTRYIYWEKLPEGFLYKLVLRDEVNKKLSKKSKRKKK